MACCTSFIDTIFANALKIPEFFGASFAEKIALSMSGTLAAVVQSALRSVGKGLLGQGVMPVEAGAGTGAVGRGFSERRDVAHGSGYARCRAYLRHIARMV